MQKAQPVFRDLKAAVRIFFQGTFDRAEVLLHPLSVYVAVSTFHLQFIAFFLHFHGKKAANSRKFTAFLTF